MSKRYTACIVIIGNEVLSGRTQDANLSFLATGLNDLGIQVSEARIIRDDRQIIADCVNDVRATHDYVLTTGGIGPPHDDITSESIAFALGVPFERNAEAEAILRNYYSPDDITEERLSMADMPAGAVLIENPVSRAPGFQIDNVFVLPGVPRIMRDMFTGMSHRLTGGAPMLSRSITAEMPEGVVAGPLGDLQHRFPDVEMGSYPFFQGGTLGTNLVLRSFDAERMAEAAEAVAQMVRDLGGVPTETDTNTGQDQGALK